MRQVIHGEIYSKNTDNINKLIADWSSKYLDILK